MKKVLFIVGSERKDSFNRQLADYAASVLEGKTEVSFLEYGDLPFINQDSEYPASDIVNRIRDDIDAADGVWIVSPEYNGSYPGLLKNLLDWVSRPLAENDWSSGSTIGGKKVTISGAAGNSAAAGVLGKLEELLIAIRSDLMDTYKTGIVLDSDAFMTNILILSEDDKLKITKQAEAFIEFMG